MSKDTAKITFIGMIIVIGMIPIDFGEGIMFPFANIIALGFLASMYYDSKQKNEQ